VKLKVNCCDGMYNSFDVHFTSACDNRCTHCVDRVYSGLGIFTPNVDKIVQTIVDNAEGVDDVLFLGGEPCLFLDDLLRCVRMLRDRTDLKVFVTTAVPRVCHDRRDTFIQLIELLDGINLSVQHADEAKADAIRRTTSQFNRQAFYAGLPRKDKIRINLNLVKPWLHTRDDIERCLCHYDRMGFSSIKVSEIQHGTNVYVSFADVFGIELKSAYAHGCQSYLDMERILPGFRTKVLLKRSCFLCEPSLSASLADGVKAVVKLFNPPTNKYGVIYEDGSLQRGWI
jgi:molybdenum cofactor biosynthesis enzyme MoaA